MPKHMRQELVLSSLTTHLHELTVAYTAESNFYKNLTRRQWGDGYIRLNGEWAINFI
ncbi:MAG: hypothetical protein WCG61_06680 [Chlorobium sp.]